MPSTPQTASENVAPCGPSTWAKAVKLFRNGANQAVRIPKEFELPSTDALIFREGNRLILEQVPEWPGKGSAAALLLAPATCPPGAGRHPPSAGKTPSSPTTRWHWTPPWSPQTKNIGACPDSR